MSTRRRAVLLLTLAVALAAVGVAVVMTTGSPAMSPGRVVEVLRTGGGTTAELTSVQDLRLPRALLALLGGASLGLAGALLQDSLGNPLASPDLLGVSAGAALVVAVVGVAHLPLGGGALAWAAAAAGLGVGAAVLSVSRTDTGARAVLFGLACAAVLNGVMICLITLAAPSDVGLLHQYLMGSLAGRSWPQVGVVVWTMTVALPVGLWLLPRLRVMRLGDDVASGLGIDVRRTRILVLAVSSVLVAGVVAVIGPVGFVALLAPHLVRRLGLTDPALVALLAIPVGAGLLVAVDGAGRALVHPREIAVGIWTSLLGAPLLLAVLRGMRARGAR